MRLRSKRALALLASSAMAALAGRAFGQQYNQTSFSLPYAGTDATALGDGVTYSAMVIQSYGTTTTFAPPNGSASQGGGDPYIVGTATYKIQTGYGFSSGSTTYLYSTSTTAFYWSPTSGFNYFGQFNASSTALYQSSGLETNYSNGTATSPAVTTPFSSLVSASVHYVNVNGENSAGTVIAQQTIEAPDSKSEGVLGRHAYAYNIPTNTYTAMGLTGTSPTDANVSYSVNFNYSNYNYTTAVTGTSTGTYANSNTNCIDNQGDVSGTTNRYYNWGGVAQTGTSNSALGTSDFFYNGLTGTTTEVGLYGNGYSYQKTLTGVGPGTQNSATGTYVSETDKGCINGWSIGTATAYPWGTSTSVGSEAWEYSSATNTSTPISLVQGAYTPSVAGFGTSYQGTPFSYTYNSSSGGAALAVHSTSLTALNALGQVAGTNAYYVGTASSTSKGTNAWIYTPSTGNYQQMGLMTNGFASGGTSSFVNLTAAQSSTVSFLNDNGQSAGTSTEYLSSGAGGTGNTSSTTVAWYAPVGQSGYQIGLTDSVHTAVSSLGYSYNTSNVTQLNRTGWVGGSSTRFLPNSTTSNGNDAWVYIPSSNQYYLMEPTSENATELFYDNNGAAISGSPPAATDYFSSSITYLSDTGYAVGWYEFLQGAQTDKFAFYWSLSTGFEDLSSDVNPALSTNSVTGAGNFIYNPIGIDNGGDTIYALGGTIPASGVQPAATTLYGLTVVPEPTSMIFLAGLAAIGCLARRRRMVAR